MGGCKYWRVLGVIVYNCSTNDCGDGAQNGTVPSQICPNFSSIYEYVNYENKKTCWSGKSTLAKLILRLLAPNEETIKFSFYEHVLRTLNPKPNEETLKFAKCETGLTL